MVWVVSRSRLKATPGTSSPYISPLTPSRQSNCASWASQPQKSVTLPPQPGGGTTKFRMNMWWHQKKKIRNTGIYLKLTCQQQRTTLWSHVQLLHPSRLCLTNHPCRRNATNKLFSHNSGRGTFHSLLTCKVSGRKYTDILCRTLNCHKFTDVRFVFESPLCLGIFLGSLFSFSRLWIAITCVQCIRPLTFRNLASYMQDGHTATLQTPHFIYFFNKYTY